MGYLRPVPYTGISTFKAHTRRIPPSQEAGVDYYCPIGTPVVAGALGQVHEIGGGIKPATGRFVTIDYFDGRRIRDLHLSQWRVKPGEFVRPDTVIGLSGASGYGSEFFGASSPTDAAMIRRTGGPHVHRTLWPTHRYTYGIHAGTLDFELYASGTPAGGAAGTLPSTTIPTPDLALLRRRKENGMYISGTSFPEVYEVQGVFNEVYPTGQALMRLCTGPEADYARTAGLVTQGYDSTLMAMADVANFGMPMPTTKRDGLEVILIQDGDALTYALWGPGYWDDTEGMTRAAAMETANAWARLYGNAKNLTYAEWADRKRVGTGGR